MRKMFYLFAAILFISALLTPRLTSAQAPQKMSYQAVIRNSSNALIISEVVGMRISILKGTSTGSSVYVETQKPTTNINGLASLEIGSGTLVSGNFATINWASGPYFIKMETDPTGGTNYTISGTSELLSVPYALYSGNGSNGASNYWTLNGSDIYNNNTASVGIGTTTPISKLSVQTATGNYGLTHTDGTVTIGTYINGNFGWFGTRSNHPLTFFTADGGPQMTLLQNGNFGIGTITPQAKLHVAGNVKVDAANTMEFGSGVAGKEGNAGKIGYESFTPDALDILGAGTLGTNRKITFWNEGGAQFRGNIGIGIAASNNKLQIGSVGSTGFSGNDIVIGNGTSATGLFQTNSFLQVVSSTDIVLFPRNNGAGRVGINTSTPRAALEVDGSATVAIPGNGYGGYAFYAIGYGSDGKPATNTGGIYTATEGLVSIYASDRIFAAEFDAFSDARIKTITGISDNWKDLETLNALNITDYTMKDKVKYGNKPFKKVIAQQVEKVYPQVVSKHTDFIPNVYQPASKIEKVANGYLLHFAHNHQISSNAKKLQLLLPDKNGMQQFNIIAIPNEKEVIIEAADLKADKAFVYGEEVDDFRTVDYEGLTTLNISATQELSKLVDKQQLIIDNLQKQINQMELRLSSLQASR